MCDMCKTIEKSLNGENPYFVKELETGIVILGWNQHFYGYTLFVCKQHVIELYDLEPTFRAGYMQEMSLVAKAVATAFGAEKMNYEALGNGDAHLHWHLFPRVNGDLGEHGVNGKGPVWFLPLEIMLSEDNKPKGAELEEMKEKLLKELNKII